MKLVLEPIFEADFHDCSYVYRPRRDAKMVSKTIRNDLYRGAWSVVEIDFRSYFTTIPHDKLMILIKQRVVDGSMLRLIKQSLTVEIAHEGRVEPTTVGVPQGSPISPLYWREDILRFVSRPSNSSCVTKSPLLHCDEVVWGCIDRKASAACLVLATGVCSKIPWYDGPN
jgi:retron-type reverse transcriptase